jgi:hypothetical protein
MFVIRDEDEKEELDRIWARLDRRDQPRNLRDIYLLERIEELAYQEGLLGGLGPVTDRYLQRLVNEAVKRKLWHQLPFRVYNRW